MAGLGWRLWLLLFLAPGAWGQEVEPHDLPRELRGVLQDPQVRARVTGLPVPEGPAPARRPEEPAPAKPASRPALPEPEAVRPAPPPDSGGPRAQPRFDAQDRPRLFLELKEDPLAAPPEPPLAQPTLPELRIEPIPPTEKTQRTPLPEVRPAPPAPLVEASRSISPLAPGAAGRLDPSSREQGLGAEQARALLARMLDSLGGPSAFRELKSLYFQMRITVFDPVGGEIFSERASHEALLASPGADRIDYQDGRVLGRRGPATWIRTGGVERPDLAGRASQELEILAFLARFPFDLADATRFEPLQAARVRQAGEERLELTLVEGATDRRHTLYLDPASLLPRELLMETACMRRRVFFPERDWKAVGPVRLAWRKVLLTEAGSPALEIAMEGLLAGREFPVSRFVH